MSAHKHFFFNKQHKRLQVASASLALALTR